MNSLNLNFVESEYIEDESSRYLGCPTVPESWLNDNNMFDSDDIFVCQINLEEASEKGVIPITKGMLYFFINAVTLEGKVLYSINEKLVKVDFNCDNDKINIDTNKEYRVIFSNTKEIYLDGTKLFGEPIESEYLNKDDVLLLQIDTLQEDNILFREEDSFYQFIIDKKSFKEKDFSKARLVVVNL